MRKLLLQSLLFYWRNHLGVLLGTLLATAVLTGSLLVGDSVDGSLRQYALQRLGGIHHVLHTPHRLFSERLAQKVSEDAAAVLQLRGMAIAEELQVNRVQVLGCDSNWWKLAAVDLALQSGEVALNRKLAEALGVEVGDEVSLRIEKPGLLPRDAPLAAQGEDQTVRGRLTVARILGDDELGRFSLAANQVVPYNAFVDRAWLSGRTELEGRVNLLAVGESDTEPTIAEVWQPEDFGLRFRSVDGVTQLETDRIYLGPEAARAALLIPGASGSLTYLVNRISKDEHSTPYSFAVAHANAGLAADEVVINRWLANELRADVGETIAMSWFELLPSSRFEERRGNFRVRRIAGMGEWALERKLAPQFPGLTDVDRCTDWEVGIPMEEAELEDEANEVYWNEYRQTPKVMVSLEAGQSMWGNRFGNLSAVRWRSVDAIEERFRAVYDSEVAGYRFVPVREQALIAVDEALDFGQLFVGMSFFLIVAALMLTALLFVFGVQRRAEQMGVLLATGWPPGTVRRLFLLEGGVIAFIGSLLGALCGTGYTRLLILGLARYWDGAVAHSTILYFARPGTVVIGAVSGFVCAMVAMAIAIWRQAKHPARELLQGDFSQQVQGQVLATKGHKGLKAGASCSSCLRVCKSAAGAVVCVLAALGVVAYALWGDAHSVTMPFFGAGALLLLSGILGLSAVLGTVEKSDSFGFGGLALRNAARRRGRSLTVAGLLACGCFMVFAVSSMKEDVAAHADQRSAGTGGFALYGESTLPIHEPLGTVRLRMREGDDASCLNLNRAQSPRLLGVESTEMSALGAFVGDEDCWSLLQMDLPADEVPGLVGDADTAMWGLEAKVGPEAGDLLEYRDDAGRTFKVRLVGYLPMRLSVFQGAVLIPEYHFVERFPSDGGYRVFLFDEADARLRLLKKYARAGLDLMPSVQRLEEFYAVESTYLAMFLVLGALGLAVGSMGMGIVVLRNVQERRTELALLCAVGYRVPTLRKLLLIEHGALLGSGLLIGLVASAVAMVPAQRAASSDLPYSQLVLLLLLVIGCGFVCMVGAIRLALRDELVQGLRNE